MSNEPKFWCGIDVAKKSSDASLVIDQNRKDLASIPVAHFDHTPAGVADFLAWVKKQVRKRKLRKNQAHFVLEATGRYSLTFYVELCKQLKEPLISIVNPGYTSHHQQGLKIRSKTDSLDAKALGLYARECKPEPYIPLSPEQRLMQRLVRQRNYLVAQRVAHENRLKEEEKNTPVYRIEMHMIEEIKKAIEACLAEIKKVLNQDHQMGRDAKLLQTIPGVGMLTAATVLAELGDLRRFERAAQLSSFTGLAPLIRESGTSVKRRTRISKAGNNQIRKGLYMAALHWTHKPEEGLGIFYKKLVDSGKAKMSALLAVERKLLVMMRAILISERPYDAKGYMEGFKKKAVENVSKKISRLRLEPKF